MGWFSKSETSSVPSRQNRQDCWDKRDAYFACLDRVGVVKAGDEGQMCSSERRKYDGSCAKSWVEYFNQRRVLAEAQKDRLAQAHAQAQTAKK